MKLLTSIGRFSLLLFHVLLGILLTFWYAAVLRLTVSDERYRKVKRWWLSRIIRILGGNVQVTGTPATSSTLLVANHISWLDIPLLGGISSVRFLSKDEVRRWPVVGWLATKAGTLFIERGKKGGAQAAVATIRSALEDGAVAVVFPEGTTSDGKQLLPFHARMFASVDETDLTIQPVAIRYLDRAGKPSETAPYIDDMSLWDNLMGLLGGQDLRIEVNYLPPVSANSGSRRELAKHCEQAISAVMKS